MIEGLTGHALSVFCLLVVFRSIVAKAVLFPVPAALAYHFPHFAVFYPSASIAIVDAAAAACCRRLRRYQAAPRGHGVRRGGGAQPASFRARLR